MCSSLNQVNKFENEKDLRLTFTLTLANFRPFLCCLGLLVYFFIYSLFLFHFFSFFWIFHILFFPPGFDPFLHTIVVLNCIEGPYLSIIMYIIKS